MSRTGAPLFRSLRRRERLYADTFNRAELLVTCDMIRLARVREALAAADIDYICRAKDLSGRGGHTSSFGVGPGARGGV